MLRIQKRHRRAEFLPHFRPLAQVGALAGRLRDVDRARTCRLALYLMAFYQIEHETRRVAQFLNQPAPDLLTQACPDFLRRQPQPGIDQPDIATRGTRADG